MAVAVQVEVTAVADVVRSTVAHYTKRHEPVVESWLAEIAGVPVTDSLGFHSCVAAIDRRIVEIVVPSATDASGLSAVVWDLAYSGWQVTVLVPASDLGSAHRALRGTPCRLQPWWYHGGELVFGHHERP